MKVCKRSIFSAILIMYTILAEKNGQEKVEVKPRDWYTEWVKSQEKPYVRTRVIEGKLLFILPEIVCKILGRKNIQGANWNCRQSRKRSAF